VEQGGYKLELNDLKKAVSGLQAKATLLESQRAVAEREFTSLVKNLSRMPQLV
jgi:hypothetical protein